MAEKPAPGELRMAQSWFYRDDAGGDQGPFPAENMRSWLLHGMLPHTTRVAPSYYGEVPQDHWPIAELWAPPTDAWAWVEVQAPAPAAAPAESSADALWKAKVAAVQRSALS